ncbi:MAG: hypothetical protein ACYCX4_00035 [Bacillota bacterium]
MKAKGLILLVLFVVLAAVGCGKPPQASTNDTSNIATSGTPEPVLGETQWGFVAYFDDGAIFMQITETKDGNLSGQLNSMSLTNGSVRQVESSNHTITGVRQGNEITINFTGSIWQDNMSGTTWTGTQTNDNLTVLMPSKNGLMQTIDFKRGTVNDYNNYVLTLKQQADQQNQQVQAEQAAQNALDQYAKAYQSLGNSVQTLKVDTKFDDILNDYQTDWVDMQYKYKRLQQIGATAPLDIGGAETTYGDMETSIGQFESDYGRLQVKDKDVTYDISQVNQNIQAVLYASQGNPQTNQQEVNQAIATAREQIRVSESALQNAKNKANGYYQNGEELLQTAKRYLDSLY